jgi:hypothetical protein
MEISVVIEMKHQIKQLIQDINNNPDKLHNDYTPSVHKLIKIGEPALEQTVKLMLSTSEDTRLRAQRVIEGVTMEMHGFRFGHGWDNDEDRIEWLKLWASLGNLSYDASSELRSKSVGKWMQWLKKRSLKNQSE